MRQNAQVSIKINKNLNNDKLGGGTNFLSITKKKDKLSGETIFRGYVTLLEIKCNGDSELLQALVCNNTRKSETHELI